MNAAHTAWCRSHFALMAEGGVWGVPRSGLVFRKQAGELLLVERMPWTDEMAVAAAAGRDVPPTPEALDAYQDDDFRTIREQFALAGIPVRADDARA